MRPNLGTRFISLVGLQHFDEVAQKTFLSNEDILIVFKNGECVTLQSNGMMSEIGLDGILGKEIKIQAESDFFK